MKNELTLTTLRCVAVVLCTAGLASTASAGRPLTVDDAGTNAKGEGHVEFWATRADGSRSLNIAPAYALADGLEIGALLARDTTSKITTTGAQVKWLITPSRDRGCNAGVAFGAAHASGQGNSDNAGFVNGLLSCNGTALGHVHANLGSTKASGQAEITNWGVAIEREFGAVTPHVEWFGVEGSKPTLQVGARGDAAKDLQLDGTIGRSDGVTLYSVGLKFRF